MRNVPNCLQSTEGTDDLPPEKVVISPEGSNGPPVGDAKENRSGDILDWIDSKPGHRALWKRLFQILRDRDQIWSEPILNRLRDDINATSAPSKPPTQDARSVADLLLSSVRAWRRKLATFEEGKIARVICRLAEKHQARSSWLYLADNEGLELLKTNGPVGPQERRLSYESLGIIARVARTREAYLASDTARDRDPHYIELAAETRSEQAVPLVFDGRLVGVLNQESPVPGAFSPVSLKTLEQDALALILHLLTLRSLRRPGPIPQLWGPRELKWSSRKLFEIIIQDLKRILEGPNAPIHLTLWYVDPILGFAFALASTGYGTEFLAEQVLPKTALPGVMADFEAGTVQDVEPKDPRLVRHEIDEAMGLRMVRAVTVMQSVNRPDRLEAGIVLNLYAFSDEAIGALPDKDELGRIAEILAAQCQGYMALRPQLASAAIRNALRECPDSASMLTCAARETAEILGAQAVTIFGRPPKTGDEPSKDLHVLAATVPLQQCSPERAEDYPAPLTRELTLDASPYRLGDGSLTGDLASEPGKLLRLNGITRDERLLVNGGTSKRKPKLRERLPKGISEFRKLLALSVRGREGMSALGVFRVVGSRERSPFTVLDFKTLNRITTVCAEEIRSWRDWHSHVKTTERGLKLRDRLGLPVPRSATRSAHGAIREVLTDLCEIVKERLGDCVLQVAVLTERPDHVRCPMEVSFYFSDLRKTYPPPADPFSPTRFRYADDDLGLRDWKDLLGRDGPVTFRVNETEVVSPERPTQVRAGAVAPFRIWCGQHSARAALSLEFSQDVEISADLIAQIHLAARKLATVLATAGPSDTQRWIAPTATHDEFLKTVAQAVQAGAVRLQLETDKGGSTFYSVGSLISQAEMESEADDPQAWSTPWIHSERDDLLFVDRDAERWGIMEKVADNMTLLKVPLWFGNSECGEIFVAWPVSDDFDTLAADDGADLAIVRSRRIRDILAYWLSMSWSWGGSEGEESPILVKFQRETTGQSSLVTEWRPYCSPGKPRKLQEAASDFSMCEHSYSMP